jgi:glycosyltransferase involved in cell wall biosynthesis
VLNQAENPEFQHLVEWLSTQFGQCEYMTGAPGTAVTNPAFQIRKGPPYDRRGLLPRTLSWMRYSGFAMRRLFASSGVNFLLATTNPPMLPHIAYLLKKTRRIPYAILVWDLYPDHIVQMKWMDGNHPIVLLWRKLNVLAFQHASVVITIGEQLARQIQAQMGDVPLPCPIEVIPNWSDTSAFRPVVKSDNAFATEHDQGSKLTVLYAGNIGATHQLESLIDAARELSTDAGISFLIVGAGLGRANLEARAKYVGALNVKFLDPVPHQQLPMLLACGDIAVVAQAPESAHLSVPSKTYNALAVGSAVLALTSATSDLAQLVTSSLIGEVCSPDDPHAIANAIRRMASDRAMLADMRDRARQLAVQQFSREICYSRFKDVFERCQLRQG